ncbi:MAG: hypothetical protein NZO16_07975 [Deltaproteobacteria bacterium]|nr:hypothetical protein [Deltaproteobacteria bacterium]
MFLDNKFFVLAITGPSGVGKSTVCKEIVKIHEENLERLVTYTTRCPRRNEQNGVDYHFVSREQFLTFLSAGRFLEVDEYAGNLYGIPFFDVQNKLKVLTINYNGVKNLKRNFGAKVCSVCLVADFGTLKERLISRASISSDNRLENAEKELGMFLGIGRSFVDFYIRNYDLNETVKKFDNLLQLIF